MISFARQSERERDWHCLGQIWGNLISFLILKPQEIGVNGTITDEMRRYDKCGAEFSEQEYKGMEVINQVERKTVN